MISFFDDLFAVDRARVEAITATLGRKGILGRVRFTCSCRANEVDRELAGMLARLGVVSVGMGLESGSDRTLHYLKGTTISVARNTEAITALKDAGVAVNASFVIGSPGETSEQIRETYKFIRNSRLDLFDVYVLTPLPGTPVWSYAKGRNLVVDQLPDWSVLDVNAYRDFERVIVLSEVLSRKQLRLWYQRFRRLRLIRNVFKSLTHPMRGDIPRYLWRVVLEYLSRFRRPST